MTGTTEVKECLCLICKKGKAIPMLLHYFPSTPICKPCLDSYRELSDEMKEKLQELI